MPSKDEHVIWAKHNRDFWMSFELTTTPFVDWVVTGVFYEAVHWVEAFLAVKRQHSDTHGQRSWAMCRFTSELSPIQIDYDTIKLDSENARYRCYKYTSHDVEKDLIPLLERIGNHISKLL